MTNSYDLVYNWFKILNSEHIDVIGYVIMPNHVHCILYFPEIEFNLNRILGNGKRFMAYEIINRLEAANDTKTLKILQDALTERERNKKQLHKVFKDSFDAKAIFSEKFLIQKLNYIHHNPVSGKWDLGFTVSIFIIEEKCVKTPLGQIDSLSAAKASAAQICSSFRVG